MNGTNGSAAGQEEYMYEEQVYEEQVYEEYAEVISAYIMNITLMSIGVGTVIMNAFVVLLILRFKWTRSHSVVIIGSMALVDLVSGVVTIWVGVIKWSDWFRTRGLVCQVLFTADLWSAPSSLQHVLAVNIERYLAIVFPLKYKNLVSAARVKCWLLVIWVFPLTGAIAYNFAYEEGENCWHVATPRPVLALAIMILYSVRPFVSVIGIYIHIVIVIIRKFRFMADSTSQGPGARFRSQRKLFVTVSVILAGWIICWLPLLAILFVMNIAEAFGIHLDFEKFVEVSYYAEIMSYANSLLNPFLYFCASSDFRKAARQLFQCATKTDGLSKRTTKPDKTTS